MIVQVKGVYECRPCGLLSAAPIIDYNKCTCASSPLLIWSDTSIGCACPDLNQIYSQKTCITCDATIYALDKKDATECNCLSSKIMKWNKVATACECNDKTAIPIVSAGTVTCQKCRSESIKGLARVTGTIDQCTCPNNLVWDPKTLSCICRSHLTITGTLGKFICRCEGTSIQPYNDIPCITC